MDPRDRDDEAEAAVPGTGAGAGEDASLAEECVPQAVVSGDRDLKGKAEEQASASLALSGERGCEEAAAAVEAEEADASPAVAGDGGLISEGVAERRGHEGDDDEEEDGYVTPTSPRHRLPEPKVCPPAPRARSEPMALPARRLRPELVMRLAASASPRKRILADLDPDELASAFVRNIQKRLFPPEDGKNDEPM